MAAMPAPRGNQLLAALSDVTLQRWAPMLEFVELPLGKMLYAPEEKRNHVYFPIDAIVSLLHVTENGSSVDIASVSNDGVVGIALILGGGSTVSGAVVRSKGLGYRVNAALLQAEFQQCHEVTQLLLRYAQALFTQTGQTAVCNRHHLLGQQLCRLLLISLDRRPGSAIVLTHEIMATMLGVRREGVTEAALRLQKAGLISYRRGRIDVLDRAGLEKRACECYAVVKREYGRLLPGPCSEHPVQERLRLSASASLEACVI